MHSTDALPRIGLYSDEIVLYRESDTHGQFWIGGLDRGLALRMRQQHVLLHSIWITAKEGAEFLGFELVSSSGSAPQEAGRERRARAGGAHATENSRRAGLLRENAGS